MKIRAPQEGYSLVELMVTLAIISIILAIAIPSANGYFAGTRRTTVTNNLVGDLSYARMEAIRQRQSVTVCASSDQAACQAGSDWTAGRIVFSDGNGNGTVDSGDVILRSERAAPSGFTITSTGITNVVTFGSNGVRVRGSVDGVLVICTSGYLGRSLKIGVTGRIDTEATASNCP